MTEQTTTLRFPGFPPIRGNGPAIEAVEAPPACAWCRDPRSDYDPGDPKRELCRPHLAEYEGLSLDGLDRMEREQAADRL